MLIELDTGILLPRLKEIYAKTKAVPRNYRTPIEDLQNLSDVQATAFALIKLVEGEIESRVKEYDDIFREAQELIPDMQGSWIKEGI